MDIFEIGFFPKDAFTFPQSNDELTVLVFAVLNLSRT